MGSESASLLSEIQILKERLKSADMERDILLQENNRLKDARALSPNLQAPSKLQVPFKEESRLNIATEQKVPYSYVNKRNLLDLVKQYPQISCHLQSV